MQDHEHYSEQVYQSKLIELDLLPMELSFVYGDLKLFHKIINKETSVELPYYLELIAPEEVMPPGSEESEAHRLRTSHKDPLYFVEKVNLFPVPTTRKKLLRFLGMTNFNRRFIDKYAEVTRPLTKLTSPKSKYVWTNEQQVAFDKIKECLNTAQGLA